MEIALKVGMFLDYSGRRRFYPINETFGQFYIEVLSSYKIGLNKDDVDRRDILQQQLNFIKRFSKNEIDSRIESLVLNEFLIKNSFLVQKLLFMVAVLRQVKQVYDIIENCLTIYFLDITTFQLDDGLKARHGDELILQIYDDIFLELGIYYDHILINVKKNILSLQPDFANTRYDNWNFQQKLLFFNLDDSLPKYNRPTQNFVHVPISYPSNLLLSGQEYAVFHNSLGMNKNYLCFKIDLNETNYQRILLLQNENIIIKPLDISLQFNWCDKTETNYIGSLTEESSPRKMQSRINEGNRAVLKNITNNNAFHNRNLNMLDLFESSNNDSIDRHQDNKDPLKKDHNYLKSNKNSCLINIDENQQIYNSDLNYVFDQDKASTIISKSKNQETILDIVKKSIERLQGASMHRYMLKNDNSPLTMNEILLTTKSSSYQELTPAIKNSHNENSQGHNLPSTGISQHLKSSKLIKSPSDKTSDNSGKIHLLYKNNNENWNYDNIETIRSEISTMTDKECTPIRLAIQQKFQKFKGNCKYYKDIAKYSMEEYWE